MLLSFRKYKCTKLIALTVAVVFLYNQIVWAQGASFQHRNVTVPYNQGSIVDIHSSQGNEVIIHLQDAHASLSAQYSIANLLDSLVTNYDLDFIALEGAEGVIDTSRLKTFPDKAIRKEAADFLMREGRMSGGEFFQITHDKNNIALYGAEEYELYKKNLEDFRKVVKQRENLLPLIKAFGEQIKLLEEKIYSKELLSIITKGREHKNGSLSFIDYWKTIVKFQSGKTNQVEIPKLVKSIALEKQIDFDKANEERKCLVGELSKKLKKEELEELVLKSSEFKEEKVSPAEFHNFLLTVSLNHNIPVKEYKNLVMFCDYTMLYESVDLFSLYSEVESVEEAVREKLFQNEDERELYKTGYIGHLLERLYNIELSTKNFEFIKSHKKEYDAKKIALFLRETCMKYGVVMQTGYDLALMMEGMDTAIEFYETAAKRDKVMVENTLKRLRKEGKRIGALITGGFHTKGLTHMLKENQVSHLVIAPKFKDSEERPYVSILTGKKKSYQKLLETEKYQIAVDPYFSPNKLEPEKNELDTEMRLLLSVLCELHNFGWNEKDITVRRMKDIVIAGIGSTPLLAIKKDSEGISQRAEITTKGAPGRT
ncbi:MAG: hypothetical protein KJ983_01045, partial [Candidatus Omnitrophica bacterium]|nr:hypothetical protein [Candidatus Omnitrophota bacterium]